MPSTHPNPEFQRLINEAASRGRHFGIIHEYNFGGTIEYLIICKNKNACGFIGLTKVPGCPHCASSRRKRYYKTHRTEILKKRRVSRGSNETPSKK